MGRGLLGRAEEGGHLCPDVARSAYPVSEDSGARMVSQRQDPGAWVNRCAHESDDARVLAVQDAHGVVKWPNASVTSGNGVRVAVGSAALAKTGNT